MFSLTVGICCCCFMLHNLFSVVFFKSNTLVYYEQYAAVDLINYTRVWMYVNGKSLNNWQCVWAWVHNLKLTHVCTLYTYTQHRAHTYTHTDCGWRWVKFYKFYCIRKLMNGDDVNGFAAVGRRQNHHQYMSSPSGYVIDLSWPVFHTLLYLLLSSFTGIHVLSSCRFRLPLSVCVHKMNYHESFTTRMRFICHDRQNCNINRLSKSHRL